MMDQQERSMGNYFYRASAANFKKIPGSPIAYWVSSPLRSAFEKGYPLKKIGDTRQGMATSDNGRFLRVWFEVDFDDMCMGAASQIEASRSGSKWFPYNKGGGYRKWYGNTEHVINWENEGAEVIGYAASLYGSATRTIKSLSEYFKPSISWSKISSGHLAMRYYPTGFIFDVAGCCIFTDNEKVRKNLLGLANSYSTRRLLTAISPTLNFETGHIASLPILDTVKEAPTSVIDRLIDYAKSDWDSYETSWDFATLPLLNSDCLQLPLKTTFHKLRTHWRDMTLEMQRLEEENNRIFIEAYELQDELRPDVPIEEITLTCNPFYRYGKKAAQSEAGKQCSVESEGEEEQCRTKNFPCDEALEARMQSDTVRELISYAIGCMMGRYSLDKPGLILASQGETVNDYLSQISAPCFIPDDDAILPLTDMEWFPDDITNRLREFVSCVWGEERLGENLDFIAQSLCLYAIKPKGSESALDTIRRYLSTQFYKDHLRTYKKRPIYWLFSSGKHKAFECLVYLHRYTEGTLSRMRTEYVSPLMGKYEGYIEQLNQQRENASATAERNSISKKIASAEKKHMELRAFDEKLRHYADKRISLDLDDGVKVNYAKFDDLLAESKSITGKKA